MFLRRIRGVLISALLGAIPWTVIGLVGGIVDSHSHRPGEVITSPLLFGNFILALALMCAGVGAINGATFAVILMLAERRRGVDELRATRIGTWSALATGGPVLAFGAPIIVASVCALIGFGLGAVALRLAQRRSHDARAALDAPAT